jgi:hypothetical protein
MNPRAKGLITITNKTNLRDFSQGIFRMRHILEGQTVDIIFNKKFKDIIMTGGCVNFKQIDDIKIREYIINNLIKQQQIIDKQKKKALIKQNIFALNKKTTDAETNQQILYLDPMTELYNSSIKKFNEYIEEYKPTIHKFEIDSLNIIDKNTKKELDKNLLLKKLVTKYFTYQTDVLGTKQNLVEEQSTEKSTEKSTEQSTAEDTNQMISIPHDRHINNTGIIYYDFRYNSVRANQILVIYKFGKLSNLFYQIKKFDILLIYDNTNNNLVIIDINNLSKFLIYNGDIDHRYTIISLYNKTSYGKTINDDLVKHLIRISLGVFDIIKTRINDKEEINILSKLIEHLGNIKYNNSFIFGEKLSLNFLQIEKHNMYPIFENHNLIDIFSSMSLNTKPTYSFDLIPNLRTPKIKDLSLTDKIMKERIILGTPRIDTQRIDTPRIDTQRIDTQRIDTPRIDTQRIEERDRELRMEELKMEKQREKEHKLKEENKKIEERERRIQMNKLNKEMTNKKYIHKHVINPRGGYLNETDIENPFYIKYIKYKAKYLNLKNKLSD